MSGKLVAIEAERRKRRESAPARGGMACGGIGAHGGSFGVPRRRKNLSGGDRLKSKSFFASNHTQNVHFRPSARWSHRYWYAPLRSPLAPR